MVARNAITATSLRKTIPPVGEPLIAGKMLAQLGSREIGNAGGPGVVAAEPAVTANGGGP
jgi:hypothetical protein